MKTISKNNNNTIKLCLTFKKYLINYPGKAEFFNNFKLGRFIQQFEFEETKIKMSNIFTKDNKHKRFLYIAFKT